MAKETGAGFWKSEVALRYFHYAAVTRGPAMDQPMAWPDWRLMGEQDMWGTEELMVEG